MIHLFNHTQITYKPIFYDQDMQIIFIPLRPVKNQMNLLHESCFFSEQSPIFMGLWFTFIPPRFSSPQREQRHGGGPSCFPRDFYNPSSDVPVQGSCSGALSSAKPPQSRGEIRVLVRWAGVGKKWQINRDTRECAVSECNLSNWAPDFEYRRK